VPDRELAVFDAQLALSLRLAPQSATRRVGHTARAYRLRRAAHEGRDISQRPLRERRARLEELIAGGDWIYTVRRLAPNGLDAWAQVLERGYEGLVREGRGRHLRRRPDALLVEGKSRRIGPRPNTAGGGY
jgi:hypothetical protein